jgi:predicted nucleic acid-binding protein
MAASALIDTGAILALLDRRDRWHGVCVAAFPQLRLPLLTSEAVLAELFHLVGDNRREMEAAWRFVLSGAVTLAEIGNSELPQVQALMLRYRDRPMDLPMLLSYTWPSAKLYQPSSLWIKRISKPIGSKGVAGFAYSPQIGRRAARPAIDKVGAASEIHSPR